MRSIIKFPLFNFTRQFKPPKATTKVIDTKEELMNFLKNNKISLPNIKAIEEEG